MRSRYIPAGVALAFVASVAMAQTSSTTSSTTGSSSGTITQSGGGVTTKKIIKGKNSQTIIQQQGNSSAAITQGGAPQRRPVPHATSPRRAARLAESRARRGGSVDRRSAYEKRVARQFGFEINPSPEFRRLFLDKLR